MSVISNIIFQFVYKMYIYGSLKMSTAIHEIILIKIMVF
jgi:hypothetical protein